MGLLTKWPVDGFISSKVLAGKKEGKNSILGEGVWLGTLVPDQAQKRKPVKVRHCPAAVGPDSDRGESDQLPSPMSPGLPGTPFVIHPNLPQTASTPSIAETY